VPCTEASTLAARGASDAAAAGHYMQHSAGSCTPPVHSSHNRNMPAARHVTRGVRVGLLGFAVFARWPRASESVSACR
jgi:hypothetical protein